MQQRKTIARFLIGTMLGLIVVVVVVIVWFREPTPMLTEETLRQAEERWNRDGPANYDMELERFGRQPGSVKIAVRQGKPQKVVIDGIAIEPRDNDPAQEKHLNAMRDAWTVPGLFAVLTRELDGVENPQREFGAPEGAVAELRAEFDPEWGYPVRYLRTIKGAELDESWQVRRFEEIDGP